MILEYLFSDSKSIQDDIKTYAKGDDSIEIEFKEINNSEIWLANFTVTLDDDKSASILSKINEKIIKKYDVTTLTNESAAYYNKTLYPLINEFERNLRKLLYLVNKISIDTSELEVLTNLEKSELGELFELLFTDKKFIKSVQTKINNKTWKYNKEEILNDLKKIQENTLWKNIIGADIMPTLQKNYITIKDYRNSIMHAHNITTEDYLNSKDVYSTVIKELEDAIDDTVNNRIEFVNIQNFNSAVLEEINNEKMDKVIAGKNDYDEQVRYILGTPTMNDLNESIKRYKDLIDTPAMKDFNESIKRYKELVDTSAMKDFNESIKRYKDWIDTPAMKDFNESIKRYKDLI